MKRFLLLTVILLAGCAHSQSGGVYSRDEVEHELAVRTGVVDSVRDVSIEGTRSPVGTAAGAVVGGVAGSSAGQGKGSAVASVLGAVIGGLGGSALEEAATRKPGVEITVKFDSGEMSSFVQEAGETFRPGDKVKIISRGGASRVTH